MYDRYQEAKGLKNMTDNNSPTGIEITEPNNNTAVTPASFLLAELCRRSDAYQSRPEFRANLVVTELPVEQQTRLH